MVVVAREPFAGKRSQLFHGLSAMVASDRPMRMRSILVRWDWLPMSRLTGYGSGFGESIYQNCTIIRKARHLVLRCINSLPTGMQC
jgi:hypothetical protein